MDVGLSPEAPSSFGRQPISGNGQAGLPGGRHFIIAPSARTEMKQIADLSASRQPRWLLVIPLLREASIGSDTLIDAALGM